jgi:hypothetical protein
VTAVRNFELASISFPRGENLPLNLAHKAGPRKCITAYFLGAFAKLRKATLSFYMSVRRHGTCRAATGRIFMKFHV